MVAVEGRRHHVREMYDVTDARTPGIGHRFEDFDRVQVLSDDGYLGLDRDHRGRTLTPTVIPSHLAGGPSPETRRDRIERSRPFASSGSESRTGVVGLAPQRIPVPPPVRPRAFPIV
ncbi:hypothetical protein ABT119_31360 [Streptomyces sp. NPDC001910]|uniref:hypothetical protein n=1 Tax=Streptomyces sp. NPDC001910 TaxID=3154403 RepID=UPI003333BA8B